MKKIAVIFGGSSSEKEVSMHTGLAVIEALKKDYEVVGISLGDDFKDLHTKLFDIDVVFNALHGGFGENGTIQSYFEKYNIKYTGSTSKSSEIAMDKNQTKIIAKSIGIPVLDWMTIENDFNKKHLDFDFPVIIKPNNGGSTIGLYYAKNSCEFDKYLNLAKRESNMLIVERYFKGKEVSVPIVDDQVLPSIEIKTANFIYDYDSKYNRNDNKYIIPASLNESVIRAISNDALKIHKKLKCRHYSRIDFLVKDNEYYFLEINTLPGLTSTSLLPKSAKKFGLDYKSLVKKIIILAS